MKKEKKQRLSALDQAIRFLSYSDRTSYDLREKLRERKYGDEEISEALEELKRVRALDDERWLENRLAYVKTTQPRGLYRVVLDLGKHGIKAQDIENKWEEMNLDEEEMARELVENRLRTLNGEGYKKRLKLNRFLGSRGFSWSVIKGVLDDMLKE